MNNLIACALLVFCLAGLGHSSPAQAQSGCSSTYDATKKFCAPVIIEPWAWYWTWTGVSHGPFASESEAIDHAISFSLGPSGSGRSFCTLEVERIARDQTPNAVQNGIPLSYSHGLYLHATKFKTDPVPCEKEWTHYVSLRQFRHVKCPDPTQPGHYWRMLSSETGGPRCEI